MESGNWSELNRAHWDELVPIHVAGAFHDVAGFLAGRSTLRPFEVDELGPVAGATLVHAQCHFGLDTLSWAREGAQVVGFDFSAAAVQNAQELAARAGLAAEFVAADVEDAAVALGGRTFDIVYTGVGAINWLPDIDGWARMMAQLLADSGRFYMTEFHPFATVFDDRELTVVESYFDRGPHLHDTPGSYADPDSATRYSQFVTWKHGLGDVISALGKAGLRIEFMHEHPYALRARWPFLERTAAGVYRMPEGRPDLPLLYSIRATRPASR